MNILSINLRGKLHTFTRPVVMGILNVTPDSFYDGGRYRQEDAVVSRARNILAQGGDIIDVGGYSSRPGAAEVSLSEELARVIPAIKNICAELPEALVSVDTFRAEVARQAVAAGAVMVNDISGGTLDEAMLPTVAQLGVPYILMHLRGTPQTMTAHTHYENILAEMTDYFQKKIHILRELGQKDIIIDPGFGFAKNITQNFYLLKHLSHFHLLGLPILVGISRKSMVYKTLKISPQEALNGTTALHMAALLAGAHLLRVHDVREAVEAVILAEKLKF